MIRNHSFILEINFLFPFPQPGRCVKWSFERGSHTHRKSVRSVHTGRNDSPKTDHPPVGRDRSPPVRRAVTDVTIKILSQ